MSFEKFEQDNNINPNEIEPLLQEDGIVIIPKEKGEEYLISNEVTTLMKALKSEGISVRIYKTDDDKPINMVEYRSADVIIYLGIIIGSALAKTVVSYVKQYIYDHYFRPKEKSNPIVKIEYYDLRQTKYITIQAPAEEYGRD